FAIRRNRGIHVVLWRGINLFFQALAVHQIENSGKVARQTGRVNQYSIAGRALLRDIVFFANAGFYFGGLSQDRKFVWVKRDRPQSAALVVDKVTCCIGWALRVAEEQSQFAGTQFYCLDAPPGLQVIREGDPVAPREPSKTLCVDAILGS